MHFVQPFHLGAAANLSVNGSVHRDTFVRAIKMAEQDKQSGLGLQLTWENDLATFEGGLTSAKRMMESGVQLVIGHYASAAAAGALSVYQHTQVPLLMPAATASHLTRDNDHAFRICSNDHSLANFIFKTLYDTTTYRILKVLHDASPHGHSLSNAICEVFSGDSYVINDSSEPEAVIFAGSYRNSLIFLHNYRSDGYTQPVYFTDDAVHHDIVQDATCTLSNLLIFGYAPSNWYNEAADLNRRYYSIYKEYPATYFLETYAAMQIAFALAGESANEWQVWEQLHNHKWQTVLGEIQFTAGECEVSRFALWRITDQKKLIAHK